jgi:hypothetical protein
VTPTTDTNTPGRRCTQLDAGNAPCQTMDAAGHLGHALQARGHWVVLRLARMGGTEMIIAAVRRPNAEARDTAVGMSRW